jgi:hypothetical protein
MSAVLIGSTAAARAQGTTTPPQARTGAVRWAMLAPAMLALIVLWAADGGGYSTVVWLPSALALLALAAWTRFVLGPGPALGPGVRAATAALAAYVAFSYASIGWASDSGAALLGSDRALLYLLMFALAANVQWSERRLELTLAIYVLALGAIAVALLVGLGLTSDEGVLLDGQLAGPTGYHNATAALGTIGAVTGIVLCGDRALSPALRAALAAAGAACLELSLLAESRGWLYTLPVIAALVILLMPARRRPLACSVIPISCVAATLPWVLHSYSVADALGGTAGERAVAGADVATARAALLAICGTALLSALAAKLGRRYESTCRARALARGAARTTGATAAAIALIAAGVAIADGSVARAVRAFTHDRPVQTGASRFGQLGGDRYDFWRVALDSFVAHPAGGLGQDNFAEAYVAARRTAEEPSWVHSLELRLLAHTGAIGFALFAGFLVMALRAARCGARASSRRGRVAIGAALVAPTVWVVHGSLDWFWEIPALSGPAFLFLGAAASFEPRRRLAPAPGSLRPAVRMLTSAARRLAPALAAGAAAAGALALGSAYLGELALQRAQARAASDPQAALRELATAAGLEPLSTGPATLRAGVYLERGDAGSAVVAAQAGLARDRNSWLLWLELGLADGAAGRFQAERAALRKARTLDPSEPVIADAQQRSGTSHPLTIAQAASVFATRIESKLGR